MTDDDIIIIDEGNNFNFLDDTPIVPTGGCWSNGVGCIHFECIMLSYLH